MPGIRKYIDHKPKLDPPLRPIRCKSRVADSYGPQGSPYLFILPVAKNIILSREASILSSNIPGPPGDVVSRDNLWPY